jgi:hypothetical protein
MYLRFSSLNSMNAAVAGSIAMNDFVAKYVKNKDNMR